MYSHSITKYLKRILPILGLMAAAATPLAAASAETLAVTFTTPDGGITTGMYDNLVQITVSGTGYAWQDSHAIADAFYFFNPSVNHDPDYFQLTFGTTTLVGWKPAQDAYHFIVGSLPAYNSSHVYSFILNTGVTSPTNLHFGFSDGDFGDNSGSYTVSVSEVPEPLSLAILATGLVGITAVRRRSSQAS